MDYHHRSFAAVMDVEDMSLGYELVGMLSTYHAKHDGYLVPRFHLNRHQMEENRYTVFVSWTGSCDDAAILCCDSAKKLALKIIAEYSSNKKFIPPTR